MVDASEKKMNLCIEEVAVDGNVMVPSVDVCTCRLGTVTFQTDEGLST
jgi:hypothetical protein